MPVTQIDPLTDPRWESLVSTHPDASIFHTAGWLNALKETYGFTPLALTSSPPNAPLTNGLVLCRVKSALTGSRLISLPFSDHCQPLVSETVELGPLLGAARDLTQDGWRYCEIRGRLLEPGQDFKAGKYDVILHMLKLDDRDRLFEGLHASSIRRKIRRAEREQLEVKTGATDQLLDDFYALQIETRRRHGRPPQPKSWFQGLRKHLKGRMSIRVAYHGTRPVAAIVTFWHSSTMTYKYGASKKAANALGGMPFLLWGAISEALDRGLKHFDLGRTDADNQGLLTFKDRFGACREPLCYLRWPADSSHGSSTLGKLARPLFSILPGPLLRGMGHFLYRHAA